MKNNIVNIAMIGCGRVAQHYKKILDSGVVSNWGIVGVYDIDPNRATFFAEHFSANSYASFESMLENAKPDLVLILTPSGLHYQHAKIAFSYGCNVLCEKPISMLPSQAEELSDIASKKGLMYGTAFQNRLNPAIMALESAIRSGRFGKIITSTIRLRWCRYQDYYEDGWHGTWLQDGGVINQQAIHHLDAINWLIGPIESINATTDNRLNNLEAEDTMVAILKLQNGALGTIEATTAARPSDFEASLSVVGEKGMVVIGGIALNKVEIWEFVEPVEGDAKAQELYSQEVETGYGVGHGPLLQGVIDSLLSGSVDALVPPEEAISTVKLVHAIYRSDEDRRWVNLRDNPISARLGR